MAHSSAWPSVEGLCPWGTVSVFFPDPLPSRDPQVWPVVQSPRVLGDRCGGVWSWLQYKCSEQSWTADHIVPQALFL